MALIGMAVYCTEDNGKDVYLEKTLYSLKETVDFKKHRLILSVNSATEKTKELLQEYHCIIESLIINDTNIGTAEAINKVWRKRRPDENCIKMDDDVVIHQSDWIEEMEEAISREPKLGQVGLKRKDCIESPARTDHYKSELIMLPHNPGEKWIVVEKVNHVMGTCVMHSAALLNKIGYLYQPKLYGFDDVLMSIRCRIAGFDSVFLPHINIDHIDKGDTPYQKWKENHASEQWKAYHEAAKKYHSDPKSIYYNPYE